MNLELSKGELFMDGVIKIGDGIPFTEEVKPSVSESLSHLYNLYNLPSVDFSVSGVDLALLSDWCSIPQSGTKFTMMYYADIMTQARWHKKPRIRKKWLKRFGMKPDTVKVCANANMLEYHPGHILDEQYDDNGIQATYDSFEFETDNLKYIWRPDHMRKGLKIEW